MKKALTIIALLPVVLASCSKPTAPSVQEQFTMLCIKYMKSTMSMMNSKTTTLQDIMKATKPY